MLSKRMKKAFIISSGYTVCRFMCDLQSAQAVAFLCPHIINMSCRLLSVCLYQSVVLLSHPTKHKASAVCSSAAGTRWEINITNRKMCLSICEIEPLPLCLLSEDSSSESGSGNGLPALTPPSSAVTDGAIVRETEVVNGNGGPAPLDFSTPTSSSSSSEDQQPMNLSDVPPQRLPLSSSHLPVTVSAAAAALLGALHPNAPEELRRKYPLAAKPPLAPHPALPLPLPHTHNAHTPNTHSQSHTHTAELRLDRDGRDYGGKVRPQGHTHTVHTDTHK